jgi:excisionase family DNA binding protein
VSNVQDAYLTKAKTREELADYLHCDVRTIDREVQRGKLKPFYVGSAVRFTPEAINDYLNSGGELTHA